MTLGGVHSAATSAKTIAEAHRATRRGQPGPTVWNDQCSVEPVLDGHDPVRAIENGDQYRIGACLSAKVRASRERPRVDASEAARGQLHVDTGFDHAALNARLGVLGRRGHLDNVHACRNSTLRWPSTMKQFAWPSSSTNRYCLSSSSTTRLRSRVNVLQLE